LPFAGVKDSNQPPDAVTPDYDDRKWLFKGLDPRTIAGELKTVPNLPVITVAEDTKALNIIAKTAAASQPKVSSRKKIVPVERLRHRPVFARRLEGRRFGISKSRGRRSTKSRWLGKYRPRASSGGRYRRRPHGIEKALAVKPGLARANFFYGEFEKKKESTTMRWCACAKFSRNIHATASSA